MAKIKILSCGVEETIRASVKRERRAALELYNQLTAAVHIGAAIHAQEQCSNIDCHSITNGVILCVHSVCLYYSDLTGEGLAVLKRARRKLARKLGVVTL